MIGVRGEDEGIYDSVGDGMGIAESNTINLRYAYKFDNTEIGASLLSGDLEGSGCSVGDHNAYAVHLKSNIGKFGVMFEYTTYEYDLDDNSDSVVVGAYSFHDTIPAEATLYNLNLSYSKDVTFGPITNLTFYNDYNLMTDKSGSYEEDTMMNVTGVAISAGGIYAYVDYIMAKNQPFIAAPWPVILTKPTIV